jgi:hypothetical protein
MTQAKRKRPVPNPVDLLVLTRDRVQEVFDDAVARGRMTRDDANSMISALFERGRGLTGDVIGDIEQLLGRSREQLDKARRATGIGSQFPISGYDDLSVAQVREKLDGLTPAELRKVRDYERRNANRKTVLQAIESKLA